MGKHPIISYPPYDTLATCQKNSGCQKNHYSNKIILHYFLLGNQSGMYTRVQLGAMQLSNGCMRAGAALVVMQEEVVVVGQVLRHIHLLYQLMCGVVVISPKKCDLM